VDRFVVVLRLQSTAGNSSSQQPGVFSSGSINQGFMRDNTSPFDLSTWPLWRVSQHSKLKNFLWMRTRKPRSNLGDVINERDRWDLHTLDEIAQRKRSTKHGWCSRTSLLLAIRSDPTLQVAMPPRDAHVQHTNDSGSTTRRCGVYGGEYAPTGFCLFAWWKKNGKKRLKKPSSGSAQKLGHTIRYGCASFIGRRRTFLECMSRQAFLVVHAKL
jgi:hypothetical protein